MVASGCYPPHHKFLFIVIFRFKAFQSISKRFKAIQRCFASSFFYFYAPPSKPSSRKDPFASHCQVLPAIASLPPTHHFNHGMFHDGGRDAVTLALRLATVFLRLFTYDSQIPPRPFHRYPPCCGKFKRVGGVGFATRTAAVRFRLEISFG